MLWELRAEPLPGSPDSVLVEMRQVPGYLDFLAEIMPADVRETREKKTTAVVKSNETRPARSGAGRSSSVCFFFWRTLRPAKIAASLGGGGEIFSLVYFSKRLRETFSFLLWCPLPQSSYSKVVEPTTNNELARPVRARVFSSSDHPSSSRFSDPRPTSAWSNGHIHE